MIYYDIQHYGDTERLKWLSSVIDDKDNIINFSLDMDVQKIEKFKIWTAKRDFKAKVTVDTSLPVTWCGQSQINQMRDMLERAIKVDGWEYFINLSGTCFPTKSQKDIKEILLHEKTINNNTSFCFAFQAKKNNIWIDNRNREDAYSFKTYNYLNRLNLSCSKRVITAFEHEGFNPVQNIMERKAVHCTEVIGEKKLILRGLEEWEIKDRISFWNKNKYMIGRTWVILHRKQVEWMLKSACMQSISDHLHQTFEPDEAFFSSVLFSNENPYINELSKNNFRYKGGDPKKINDYNFEEALDDHCFFARKLSASISKESLQSIKYRTINK